MKIKVIKYEYKNINVISNRHATFGEIITPKKIYRPMLVLCTYFEPFFIDQYGLESEEILNHGTNYVDCIDINGGEERLQYYEYVILKNAKRIKEQFEKQKLKRMIYK